MIATSVSMPEIAGTTSSHYPILAANWTDASAHPDYRPLPEGVSDAYGQCIPTSEEERRALSTIYPKELFRLAAGSVWAVRVTAGRAALRPIIPSHIWVDWGMQAYGRRVGTVIDQTSGQSLDRSLPEHLVAAYVDLAAGGILYRVDAYYADADSLVDRLIQSEPGIRERIGLLHGVLG